jgi:predicted ArsR family transcriptional regulator
MERTEVLSDAGCIFHPVRFRIVRLLTKKKLSISGMAKRLRIDRGVAAFHLATLENHGLVKKEYQLPRPPKKNRPGVARNIYQTTEKVGQVVDDFKIILRELKQEARV